MKIKIIYDNGQEEEVEMKKIEIVGNKDRSYAHYKYAQMNDEKILIFHIYLPTNEEPAMLPGNIEAEIRQRMAKVSSYVNVADDLIARARIAQIQPQKMSCAYCGDVGSNQYNGKIVCTSCFKYLIKYGENSKEFNEYLTRKLIDKWK
ncbi:hypothetical protein V6M85_02400 [Sulfolobus tengchongensis]|uniref:Uncharacterized protein n=1 Tax=Sulfolobus tengchongensis TaxID=207809 RepID=A0AAX4L177_9CREN